jgi:hypothetical protein
MKQQKKNLHDNINYFENYEDLTGFYYGKFKNKSFLEIITTIYEEENIKLDDNNKLVDVKEFKFLIHSLISVDYENLLIKKFDSIRIKLFNYLKETDYTIKDVLRFIQMLRPIFINNMYFRESSMIFINNSHLYDILTHENISAFKKWKLKYLIFILKVLRLLDVPLLKDHDIYKFWKNKYNFEQRKEYIYEVYIECGTLENMSEGALIYFKYHIEYDETLIKNNRFPFIVDIVNKYNNIFKEDQPNLAPGRKIKKNKCVCVS